MTDGICKNKIIFVPGKNPKPSPEDHRALLWRCLRRGLELVDPAAAQRMAAHPDCFQLVAWNAIYYGQVKDVDEDVPWIEALCHKTGPDAADVREALSWRNKRARLLYTLGDLFAGADPAAAGPGGQEHDPRNGALFPESGRHRHTRARTAQGAAAPGVRRRRSRCW